MLTETGLVQVVRTRRVRAIEERFYGRTARMFFVGVERSPDGDDLPRDFNDFEVAAEESAAAYRDGKLWGFIRHARISEAQASEFWERMAELVAEFDQLPRSGATVYGFAVGVYPTDHPTLPSGETKRRLRRFELSTMALLPQLDRVADRERRAFAASIADRMSPRVTLRRALPPLGYRSVNRSRSPSRSRR